MDAPLQRMRVQVSSTFGYAEVGQISSDRLKQSVFRLRRNRQYLHPTPKTAFCFPFYHLIRLFAHGENPPFRSPRNGLLFVTCGDISPAIGGNRPRGEGLATLALVRKFRPHPLFDNPSTAYRRSPSLYTREAYWPLDPQSSARTTQNSRCNFRCIGCIILPINPLRGRRGLRSPHRTRRYTPRKRRDGAEYT